MALPFTSWFRNKVSIVQRPKAKRGQEKVQIPDEAVSISHTVNTLEKGMHPTILSPAILHLGIDKIIGQIGLFKFGMSTGIGEGKLWIQTNVMEDHFWTLILEKCRSWLYMTSKIKPHLVNAVTHTYRYTHAHNILFKTCKRTKH